MTFQVGDYVKVKVHPLATHAPAGLNWKETYRVTAVVADERVYLSGVFGPVNASRLELVKGVRGEPNHQPNEARNPFKVGDKAVPADAHTDNAQMVEEVCGEFVRLKASERFQHHSELKKYQRPEEVIVIKTDGDKTEAFLKVGGQVKNKVALRRHPKDRHDLKVLMAYVGQRLLPNDGRELVARPEGYCGAVAISSVNKCDSAYDPLHYPKGLLMEFYGGKWKDAPLTHYMYGMKFRTFEDLKTWMESHGVEIVELHRNVK